MSAHVVGAGGHRPRDREGGRVHPEALHRRVVMGEVLLRQERVGGRDVRVRREVDVVGEGLVRRVGVGRVGGDEREARHAAPRGVRRRGQIAVEDLEVERRPARRGNHRAVHVVDEVLEEAAVIGRVSAVAVRSHRRREPIGAADVVHARARHAAPRRRETSGGGGEEELVVRARVDVAVPDVHLRARVQRAAAGLGGIGDVRVGAGLHGGAGVAVVPPVPARQHAHGAGHAHESHVAVPVGVVGPGRPAVQRRAAGESPLIEDGLGDGEVGRVGRDVARAVPPREDVHLRRPALRGRAAALVVDAVSGGQHRLGVDHRSRADKPRIVAVVAKESHRQLAVGPVGPCCQRRVAHRRQHAAPVGLLVLVAIGGIQPREAPALVRRWRLHDRRRTLHHLARVHVIRDQSAALLQLRPAPEPALAQRHRRHLVQRGHVRRQRDRRVRVRPEDAHRLGRHRRDLGVHRGVGRRRRQPPHRISLRQARPLPAGKKARRRDESSNRRRYGSHSVNSLEVGLPSSRTGDVYRTRNRLVA